MPSTNTRNSSCSRYSGVFGYYPFGMQMQGREFAGGMRYRWGFNSQEADSEVSGKGNSYTAEFWQYDTRLGRRWNMDPRPNSSISDYVTFSNNPIFYSDVRGDTIRGVNATSGTRTRDAIHNSFKGDNAADLRELFKLDADGKTMAPINQADFINAVSGLTSDQQQLAYGYFNAINSTDIHNVEMVNQSETLTANGTTLAGLDAIGNPTTTGAGVDKKWGGGFNGSVGSGTYSVIVLNSTANIGDYRSGSGYTSRTSSSGELLAHELLGHGLGLSNGSTTWGHQDAIQMTNLFLRTQGVNNVYRDGRRHGSGVVLSQATATTTPSFIQLPASIQSAIYRRQLMIKVTKPVIAPRDKTFLKPIVIIR